MGSIIEELETLKIQNNDQTKKAFFIAAPKGRSSLQKSIKTNIILDFS